MNRSKYGPTALNPGPSITGIRLATKAEQIDILSTNLTACQTELAALRAQRDILREAIDRIRLREPGPDGPSGDYAMCKLIANDAFNAIAKLEGGGK